MIVALCIIITVIAVIVAIYCATNKIKIDTATNEANAKIQSKYEKLKTEYQDLKKDSDLIFDTHLMIEKPERMIESFIDAGSDIITVHAEATNHLERCLSMIKKAGVSCGVAINPGTPVSLLEAVLDEVDLVLVMTVNPGWGGQKFIPSTLKKIQELDMRREEEGFSYQIEVDGGINRETVKLCYDRGVTLAVMGTAFFKEADKKSFVQEIINSL